MTDFCGSVCTPQGMRRPTAGCMSQSDCAQTVNVVNKDSARHTVTKFQVSCPKIAMAQDC